MNENGTQYPQHTSLHCPSWCRTDHDNLDDRVSDAERGLLTEHWQGINTQLLPELHMGGHLLRGREEAGTWMVCVNCQVSLDGTENGTYTLVTFLNDSGTVTLPLTSSECRSLAASLTRAADVIELSPDSH